MKEYWIIEAERSARNLSDFQMKEIIEEADRLCIDREWYFWKVIQFMREEMKTYYEVY